MTLSSDLCVCVCVRVRVCVGGVSCCQSYDSQRLPVVTPGSYFVIAG